MSEVKAVLFDADGVVIVPQKVFAKQYAKTYGLELAKLESFFRGAFSDAVTGRADLKDLIRKHRDIWQWGNDPQGLLDLWFEAENQTDTALMRIIAQQRAIGRRIYMATNQEKYRANYLRETIFPGMFEYIFVSSEIGYMKRERAYWTAVLNKLRSDIPGIKVSEVLFFDDSQDSIEGAKKAGINAYLYAGIEQVRRLLN